MITGTSLSEYLNTTWEVGRNMIKEELEQIRQVLSSQWSAIFNADNTLRTGAIGGSPTGGRRYVANTGPKFSPKWEKAVYSLTTDNVYIGGGPILDVGQISATIHTSATIEEALHNMCGGASL